MYRFLLSPGWLGRLAAALALAVAMSLLGAWQLDRYEQRSAINQRIDAADVAQAAPLASLLTPPAPAEPVGPPPPEAAQWAMATATGRYDQRHEILVRNRTLDGQVGIEVVTPLVLADGSAVLVARGWLPAPAGGAAQRPVVPPAPAGEVTVAGRVRPGERPAPVERLDGDLHTRRVGVEELAAHLPYPIYHGYLQLASQRPAGDPALVPVPPRRENAWMNGGYAAQWWIFAGLVLVGFGWLARREARRGHAGHGPGPAGAPATGPVAPLVRER